MIVIDKNKLNALKLQRKVTAISTPPTPVPEPVPAPEPAPLPDMSNILDRITALLEKPAPIPEPIEEKGDDDIKAELLALKAAVNNLSQNRKFQFKIKRDSHDFITDISAVEL